MSEDWKEIAMQYKKCYEAMSEHFHNCPIRGSGKKWKVYDGLDILGKGETPREAMRDAIK